MRVARPPTEAADEIADHWVALAEDQRAHGSHLRAETNRERVREAILRHVITDSLLVAYADGETSGGEAIVGFVMFSVESGSFEQDVRRGVVENLYVDPDHRESGVGADLLDAAEAALAERGCEVVALEVLADNERARRFYARQGYGSHRLELEKRLDAGSDTP